MGTIRNADVVCVVTDVNDAALEQTEMVLGVLSECGLTLRTAGTAVSKVSRFTKPKFCGIGI